MRTTVPSGELQHRVALYKPVYRDDGQGGKQTLPPELVGTVWAKILKPRFWAGQTGAGPGTAITQGIVIRIRDDITYDWTVVYRGQKYKILHLDYSAPDMITLTCQAVVAHG